MEAVDVLRHQRVQLSFALELREIHVPGVRLGAPGFVVGAGTPRANADLPVANVVLERGHLLGLGVLRPDPLGTSEVRYPRLGRDAGPGQDDDAVCRAYSGRDLFDVGRLRHIAEYTGADRLPGR